MPLYEFYCEACGKFEQIGEFECRHRDSTMSDV